MGHGGGVNVDTGFLLSLEVNLPIPAGQLMKCDLHYARVTVVKMRFIAKQPTVGSAARSPCLCGHLQSVRSRNPCDDHRLALFLQLIDYI